MRTGNGKARDQNLQSEARVRPWSPIMKLVSAKWAHRVIAIVGIAIFPYLLVASNVEASSRWYGVAAWYNAVSNRGSAVQMVVPPGSCVDYSTGGFIAQVLWQGTNSDVGLNYWVEEGYTYGWQGKNILAFYWADNRPNGGGYHEHPIPNIIPKIGSSYDVEIYWYTTNWLATINGIIEGNSTSNPLYGKALETGVESTSPNSNLYGAESNSLAYLNSSSGYWVSGWGSATGLHENAPAYATWNLTDVNLYDGM